MRMLTALSLACVCLATVDEVQALDVEKTGEEKSFDVRKSGLPSNATANLTLDYQYLYRASALMGSPVVNCGVRVKNITGTVSFDYQGKNHEVEITPENAGLVRAYDADLLVFFERGRTEVALKCNAGVVAGESTQPFNVPSSPQTNQMFCSFPPRSGEALPDRLLSEWCERRQGRFLQKDDAISLFAQAGQHGSAGIELGGLSVSVADLIAAERKRLREEAKEKGEAARMEKVLEALNEKTEPEPAEPEEVSEKESVEEETPMQPEAQTAARTAPKPERRNPVSDMLSRLAKKTEGDNVVSEEEGSAETSGESPPGDDGSQFSIVYSGCPTSVRFDKQYYRTYWHADDTGNCLGPYYHVVGDDPKPFSEGYAPVMLEMNDQRHDYTYVDTQGNVHFGPFEEARSFVGGVAVTKRHDAPEEAPFSAINRKGEVLFSYHWISDFSPSGFTIANDFNKRTIELDKYTSNGWGIINREGEIIVPFKYFGARVEEENGKTVFYITTDVVRSQAGRCNDIIVTSTILELDTQGRHLKGPYEKGRVEKDWSCGGLQLTITKD